MALLLLGACSEETPQAEAPRPVRTIVVAPAPVIDTIVQTGEIEPHTQTDIGFRIDGRLATRTVELGAVVHKGQILATLAPQDAQNDVRSAEADLESAVASETLAKSAMDRQRLLFEKQIAAAAKVEESEANWRSAVARRESAEALLANARNRLGYTDLVAPQDGIVTAVLANPGQVVGAGQAVLRLASPDERDAVFNVSEKVLNAVPADVAVEVALVSNPQITARGHVRDVSPTADPVTRSYRVRIVLPEAPAAMIFGAAVTGRVMLDGPPLITLPASALTSADGRPAVFVVDPERQVLVRKPVTVARYTADHALISDGLSAGDAVVTAGVSKLRPDQKVAYSAASTAGSAP